MAPNEHINWFEDNIDWYEHLDLSELETAVPSCPGWTIEYVLNHLSHGLGLAYPAAMAKPPETAAEHAFDDVDWPNEYPTGQVALDTFTTNMAACVSQFSATDPRTPCWTYAGAGTAAFWFRRAAIETTLHRMDVLEALGSDPKHLADDRASDAIEETLSFVLPLAADMTAIPDGQLVIDSPCLQAPVSTGSQGTKTTIEGESHDVLNALWGRHRDRVQVTGDRHTAHQWLTLIETAFAGR